MSEPGLEVLFPETPAEGTPSEATVEPTTEVAPEVTPDESVNATPATQGETQAVEGEPQPEGVEATDPEDGRTVPLKALIEQRKKRQEVERRLAHLEGQLEATQTIATQPSQQAQEPTEDFDNDRFYSEGATYVKEVAQSAAAQAVQRDRLERSVTDMATQHEDYFEMEAVFMQAAKSNPSLAMELQRHPYPARYAYQYAKQLEAAKQYGGSVEEMREKIREEERARIEQEMKQKTAATTAQSVPKSNANARGVGSKAAPAWNGPTDLGDILGNNGL